MRPEVRAAWVMAALALIWGYAWIAAKIALAYAGPFDFAWMRVAVGTVTLAVIVAASGRRLSPMPWRSVAVVGCVQTAAFLIFNTWALVDSGPGKTSILTFTMPFWVLLFAWPVLGERLRGIQWLAIALALSGLAAILEPWEMQTSLLSKLLAVLAGISWAAGVVFAKRLHNRQGTDALQFTFWQMLVGLVPMLLIGAVVPQKPVEWNAPFVACLLFSGVIATGLGWYMWLYVLHRLPAGTTGLSSLAVPVVAAVSSAVQLGEHLRPAELAGMTTIAAALALNAWHIARRHRHDLLTDQPPD